MVQAGYRKVKLMMNTCSKFEFFGWIKLFINCDVLNSYKHSEQALYVYHVIGGAYVRQPPRLFGIPAGPEEGGPLVYIICTLIFEPLVCMHNYTYCMHAHCILHACALKFWSISGAIWAWEQTV